MKLVRDVDGVGNVADGDGFIVGIYDGRYIIRCMWNMNRIVFEFLEDYGSVVMDSFVEYCDVRINGGEDDGIVCDLKRVDDRKLYCDMYHELYSEEDFCI